MCNDIVNCDLLRVELQHQPNSLLCPFPLRKKFLNLSQKNPLTDDDLLCHELLIYFSIFKDVDSKAILEFISNKKDQILISYTIKAINCYLLGVRNTKKKG